MLIVESHQIQSDLLVLDTHKYNVILGMDWLTKNTIYIECAKHHGIFYQETLLLIAPPDTQIFEHNIELTVVDHIPIVEEEEYSKLNPVSTRIELEKIPVARYFPQVFSEELLEMPPE